MHKNHLDGTIPSEVGKMSNLRNLRAYTNGMKGSIPDEIGGAWKIGKGIVCSVVRRLGSLWIQYSNSFRVSIHIENLYLHDNLLTGTLPSSIQDMTKLRKFASAGRSMYYHS